MEGKCIFIKSILHSWKIYWKTGFSIIIFLIIYFYTSHVYDCIVVVDVFAFVLLIICVKVPLKVLDVLNGCIKRLFVFIMKKNRCVFTNVLHKHWMIHNIFYKLFLLPFSGI